MSAPIPPSPSEQARAALLELAQAECLNQATQELRELVADVVAPVHLFASRQVRNNAYCGPKALLDHAMVITIVKVCACGAAVSAAEWTGLRLVGTQPGDGGDPALEIRNCAACSSSLAVELPPEFAHVRSIPEPS